MILAENGNLQGGGEAFCGNFGEFPVFNNWAHLSRFAVGKVVCICMFVCIRSGEYEVGYLFVFAFLATVMNTAYYL